MLTIAVSILQLRHDMTRHFILLYLFYRTFLPSTGPTCSATLFSGNHHIADITDIADIADILQEDTGFERNKLRWLVSDRKNGKNR